jgi:type I restriction enzyme S subunit
MSKLPDGWISVRIGDIVYINPKQEHQDDTTVGFVPMARLGTSYRSTISFEPKLWADVKRGYTQFMDGDVLLAKITPCFENGKAGLVFGLPSGVGAGSTEYFVNRPILETVDPRYLLAFFKTDAFLNNGETQMTGSVGHKRVPKEYLLESRIPLAPLKEQKRIADKLEAVLARVDACRDRLDRIPAILKRFRQSVLDAAISGRLTEDWRNHEKNLWEWTNQPLGMLCSRVSVGHVGETSKHYTTEDQGVAFLRSQNVRPGRVSLDGLTFITQEFHKKLKKSQLCPGDLLVVRVGANRGDSCVLPDIFTEVNCANIVFARPTKVLPSYLNVFFQSPSCQDDLLGRTVGGAQGVINTKSVEQVMVAVPPVLEQTEIVRRVESLFAYADRLEARYNTARAQVEKLTPALLAKAFRGELVPQDPNDEPASELLARIAAGKTAEQAKTRAGKRQVKPS